MLSPEGHPSVHCSSMPTSELSNALNPYVNQYRQQNVTAYYDNTPVQYQPTLEQQPQRQQFPANVLPHQQHHSELEYAIIERPLVANVPNQVAQRQPTTSSVQAVHELLRMVTATRETQEQEHKRRLEWEHQQEIRNAQREAHLERMISELRQEVACLRGNDQTQSHTSGLLTPQHHLSPPVNLQNHDQPVSPISPVSSSANGLYSFAQELSSDINFHTQTYDPGYTETMGFGMPTHETPAPSITPSPSPQLTCVQPSMLHSESPAPVPTPGETRKRTISALSSDDEPVEDDGDSDHSENFEGSRPKRQNHHDMRILTVNSAMRKHILLMMDLTDDRELPGSHVEGQPLTQDKPVRFVWEKTSKQSTHNTRMKNRILEDIKTRRKLYKHVPDKDFLKKALESAFEQAYTTFRQKYRSRQDDSQAQSQKKRDNAKAQKSRRVSRKKLKLSNRSEARIKLEAFAHVTFDGALQIECMSSEESDQESNPPANSLRTRGFRWRSTRLIRFYGILDDGERADKSYKPKRGVGKKDRVVGPPKGGFSLPPNGVASWMVSKRWIRESSVQFPDLPDALEKRLDDSGDFDWDEFGALGDESDVADEDGGGHDDFEDAHDYRAVHHPSNVGTGSSLDFALVHPS